MYMLNASEKVTLDLYSKYIHDIDHLVSHLENGKALTGHEISHFVRVIQEKGEVIRQLTIATQRTQDYRKRYSKQHSLQHIIDKRLAFMHSIEHSMAPSSVLTAKEHYITSELEKIARGIGGKVLHVDKHVANEQLRTMNAITQLENEVRRMKDVNNDLVDQLQQSLDAHHELKATKLDITEQMMHQEKVAEQLRMQLDASIDTTTTAALQLNASVKKVQQLEGELKGSDSEAARLRSLVDGQVQMLHKSKLDTNEIAHQLLASQQQRANLQRQMRVDAEGLVLLEGKLKQLQDNKNALLASKGVDADGRALLERKLQQLQTNKDSMVASNAQARAVLEEKLKQLQLNKDSMAALSADGLSVLEEKLEQLQANKDSNAQARAVLEEEMKQLRFDREALLRSHDVDAEGRAVLEGQLKQLEATKNNMAASNAEARGVLERELKQVQSDKEALLASTRANAEARAALERQLKQLETNKSSMAASDAEARAVLEGQLKQLQANKNFMAASDADARAVLEGQLKQLEAERESLLLSKGADAEGRTLLEGQLRQLQANKHSMAASDAEARAVLEGQLKQLEADKESLLLSKGVDAEGRALLEVQLKQLQANKEALMASTGVDAEARAVMEGQLKQLEADKESLLLSKGVDAEGRASLEGQLKQLQTDKEALLASRDIDEAQLKQLLANKEALLASKAMNEDTQKNLQKKLNDKDSLVAFKNADTKRLETEVEKSKSKVNELQQQLKNLENADALTKTALQNALNKSQLNSTHANVEKTALSNELRIAREEATLQKTLLSQQVAMHQSDALQIEEGHKEIAELQAKLTKLETKAEADESERSSILKRIQQTADDVDVREQRMMEKLNESDKTIVGLKLNITENNAALQAAERTITDLGEQLANGKQLMDKLHTDSVGLHSANNTLVAALHDKDVTLQEQMDRLTVAESNALAQDARYNALVGENERVLQEVAVVKAEAADQVMVIKNETAKALDAADQEIKHQAAEMLKVVDRMAATDKEHSALKSAMQEIVTAGLLDQTRLEEHRERIEQLTAGLLEKESELDAGRKLLVDQDAKWAGVLALKDEAMKDAESSFRAIMEQAAKEHTARGAELVDATGRLAQATSMLHAAHDEVLALQQKVGLQTEDIEAGDVHVDDERELQIESLGLILEQLIQLAEGKARDGYERNYEFLRQHQHVENIIAKEGAYKKALRELKSAAYVCVVINTWDVTSKSFKPLPYNLKVSGNVVLLNSKQYSSFYSVQIWSENADIENIYSGRQKQGTSFKEMVHASERGASSVIFTYGISGSGKTEILFGRPRAPGLMIAALRDLENLGAKVIHERDFVLYGTFDVPALVERPVYWQGDQLRTLTHRSDVMMSTIIEVPGALHISGQVVTPNSILQTLSNHPKIKSTPNNSKSSRGHLFMTWRVLSSDGTTGFLTFIDMAGAESPKAIAEVYAGEHTRHRLEAKLPRPAQADIERAVALSKRSAFYDVMTRHYQKSDHQYAEKQALHTILTEGFFINETLNELADFFNLEQHKELSRGVQKIDGVWKKEDVDAYDFKKSVYTDAMIRAAYNAPGQDTTQPLDRSLRDRFGRGNDPVGFIRELVKLKDLGSQSSVFTMVALANPYTTTHLEGVSDTLDFADRL